MKNITSLFDQIYVPRQALLVYELQGETENPHYVELFDLDEQGTPMTAHPLSMSEARSLSLALMGGREKQNAFLNCNGLIPENVLYIEHIPEPVAIWYTPAQHVKLLFNESLSIPNGVAGIPPLVWKATKQGIWMYALKSSSRPTLQTKLHQAPFFNVHDSGSICMGNVDVSFDPDTSIQQFIAIWEQAFFGSYFTHMIAHQSPTKGNIVELWQSLVGQPTPFPTDQLKSLPLTLQKILQ